MDIKRELSHKRAKRIFIFNISSYYFYLKRKTKIKNKPHDKYAREFWVNEVLIIIKIIN